jgi:hypothetical protein
MCNVWCVSCGTARAAGKAALKEEVLFSVELFCEWACCVERKKQVRRQRSAV